MQRHPGLMPKGGACSAIISAACHPIQGDKDIEMKAVKWGVIPRDRLSAADQARFLSNAGSVVGPSNLSSMNNAPLQGRASTPTRNAPIISAAGAAAANTSPGTNAAPASSGTQPTAPGNGSAASGTPIGTSSVTSAGNTSTAGPFAGKCCFSSLDVEEPKQGVMYI